MMLIGPNLPIWLPFLVRVLITFSTGDHSTTSKVGLSEYFFDTGRSYLGWFEVEPNGVMIHFVLNTENIYWFMLNPITTQFC